MRIQSGMIRVGTPWLVITRLVGVVVTPLSTWAAVKVSFLPGLCPPEVVSLGSRVLGPK